REWLLRAPAGTCVVLTADGGRAGVVRTELLLSRDAEGRDRMVAGDSTVRETAARETAIRDACVDAALEAWESAGISGLCAEGRWEVAIGAIRSLDPRTIERE
ncbi:MAG TPA: hypothetical protein PK177_02840, partial [Burkholderiaceae bacterium]|nr:hypothetical protein [Burkholderiaceae bacterium]